MSAVFTPRTGALQFNRSSAQANGLLTWFPMTEGSQSMLVDRVGGSKAVVNSSGTVPTVLPEGGYRSHDFGTAGTGGYYTAPHANRMDITNRFTVMIWYRCVSTAGASRYLYGKMNSGATNNTHAMITEYTDACVSFYAAGYSGGNPRTASDIPIPDTTSWHHYAYSFDGGGGSGDWIRWLDGVPTTIGAPGFSLSTSAGNLVIGNYNTGNTASPPGRIRDLRFYNRPLSQSEMKAIWHPNTRFELWQVPRRRQFVAPTIYDPSASCFYPAVSQPVQQPRMAVAY